MSHFDMTFCHKQIDIEPCNAEYIRAKHKGIFPKEVDSYLDGPRCLALSLKVDSSRLKCLIVRGGKCTKIPQNANGITFSIYERLPLAINAGCMQGKLV